MLRRRVTQVSSNRPDPVHSERDKYIIETKTTGVMVTEMLNGTGCA